jgi:ketosteroid isomerase-like protein
MAEVTSKPEGLTGARVDESDPLIALGGALRAPAAPVESENIAIVRRAFEAFERRDLDALAELTDPHVELFAPTAVLANEGRCYRGHGGLARYLLDVERTWASLQVIPQKFRETGNHVVCLGHVAAKARDGLEVDSPTAWVWELCAGKLRWGCVYADPGETFMGLSLAGDLETPVAGAFAAAASQPARVA